MKKIDFKVPIINLNGTNSTDPLAMALAEFIGSETTGNTVKLYGWYRALREKGVLELDEADIATLTQLIENTDRLRVFLKGQYLSIIKKANS